MMEKKHGPWTIKGRESKYRHELMEILEDQVVKPNGEPGKYTTARIKPGVAVVPVDAEGFAYLITDARYAIGRESVEAAAGAIDEGERPLDAAKRELREEIGIEAGEWTELGLVDPITSLVDSPSHLFLARGLKFGEKRQEGGETMETARMKLDEARRMALDGRITHGSSCVLIFRAHDRLTNPGE